MSALKVRGGTPKPGKQGTETRKLGGKSVQRAHGVPAAGGKNWAPGRPSHLWGLWGFCKLLGGCKVQVLRAPFLVRKLGFFFWVFGEISSFGPQCTGPSGVFFFFFFFRFLGGGFQVGFLGGFVLGGVGFGGFFGARFCGWGFVGWFPGDGGWGFVVVWVGVFGFSIGVVWGVFVDVWGGGGGGELDFVFLEIWGGRGGVLLS